MPESPSQSTVLVVDDAPDSIAILHHILGQEFRVLFASDGPSGLELARTRQPDVILLDVSMTGMSGFTVCRHLKADAATAAIPVIFVTSMTEETDETQGFALGAVDYITKPIRPPVVRARVGTHLRLRQAQRRLEEQKRELEQAARLRDDVERITRHDLKTPLISIIGVPSILETRYRLAEGDTRLLRTIERAGRKMLAMINRSLDLYKMEVGTYPLQARSMNLVPLLRSTLDEVLRLSSAQGKHWVWRLAGRPVESQTLCLARVEEMLCYPMFTNLLQNAFEASPPGETVAIDLDRKETAIAIGITNAGVVPPQIRAGFFDKYTTCGKLNGTGLGTYSARLCAETQRGSIAMEILEERQTRITVLLPAG